MEQIVHPLTPAYGISFAHLQKLVLQLLCVILEALSEGVNQTGCTAFIFHQLYAVPWKPHRGRHKVKNLLSQCKSLQLLLGMYYRMYKLE